jgi:hypothetical protein
MDDLTLASIVLGREAAGHDAIPADGLGREEQSLKIEIEHGVSILFGDFRGRFTIDQAQGEKPILQCDSGVTAPGTETTRARTAAVRRCTTSSIR